MYMYIAEKEITKCRLMETEIFKYKKEKYGACDK